MRKLLGGSQTPPAIDTLQTLEEDTELSRDEFKQLLETIDSGLRALPATAQVRRMLWVYLVTDRGAAYCMNKLWHLLHRLHHGSSGGVSGLRVERLPC